MSKLLKLAAEIEDREAEARAANMINQTLKKYPAPIVVGEFLKGLWFQNAKQVLLKCGSDSNEWQHIATTTEMLLRALQRPENPSKTRQQRLADMAKKLPHFIESGMCDVQDQEVSDALATIEGALRCTLGQDGLKLETIKPIPVADDV